MARADSTIRVNIIGNAKELTRATDKAQAALGGFSKQQLLVGGAIAGGFLVAADAALEFSQTALKEADRVGDATGRLEDQLGELSAPLIDAADEFSKLGASEGDMLELEARISDIGRAAEISTPQLAAFADDAASTAAGLALITDEDADVWIDRIGKAAGGAAKPLKDLGISLTDAEVAARAMADTGKDNADALTAGELAAARLELILEKLAPRLEEVKNGSGDLEQKQKELEARWETLTGKIGAAIEGPLTDLLGFLLTGIDQFEQLADNASAAGVSMDNFVQSVKLALGPIGRAIDGASELVRILRELAGLTGVPGAAAGSVQRSGGGIQKGAATTNLYVQGGSPEAIEQAVRNALNTTARRG